MIYRPGEPIAIFRNKVADNQQLTRTWSWRGLTRRFVYLLGAFWFGEALQSLFSICLARWDSVTFGQFFLGLSLGQMVLFVSEFGLNQHLAVMLSRKHAPTADLLIQASILKASLLLLSWLGLAGFVTWQGYSPSLRMVVLVLAAGLGLEAVASTFFVWLQIQGRQGSEAGIRAGASLLGFGHAFTSLWLGAAAWILVGYRLLESLAALAAIQRLAARTLLEGGLWPSWSSLWRNWSGGLVFTAMAAAAILYNRLNVIFLHNYAGDQHLAQYGAAWQLVDGLTNLVVVLLLNKVMLPKFLRLWESDRPALLELAREAAYWLLLASLALSFLLMAASQPIIGLLYGPAYSPAAQMQEWLSCTVVLGIMHNLAGYLMIAMGRQKLLLVFFLVTLCVNITACVLMIPSSPLAGAVAAMVVSKALLACMSVGYCHISLGLFVWPRIIKASLAAAAGVLIYLLASVWLGPVAAAVAGLMPLVILAWRQRTSLAAQRLVQG